MSKASTISNAASSAAATVKEEVSEATDSVMKKVRDTLSPADAEFQASKQAALEALDKMMEARQHFQKAATEAGIDIKDEAVEQLMIGKMKAEELGHEFNEMARNKPVTTMAVAFLGGFLLAQMMSRK